MQHSNLLELQQPYEELLTRAIDQKIVERLWARDLAVFGKPDDTSLASIGSRLGWLQAPEDFLPKIAELEEFAAKVIKDGYTSIVLLGMGGSSLCVEVTRETFGIKSGYPMLHVLDSTHPDQIAALEAQLDLKTTLFIVASKSGSTIETDSFYRYFWSRVAHSGVAQPGKNFMAITDPNTAMAKEATDKSFYRTFLNPPDIGGRFSALSYFGLVPAALMGVELERFLGRAIEEVRSSRNNTAENPALALGVLLAAAHNAGRNKLTLRTSGKFKTFGFWAEQLVAESTGKEGKGILPVEGESPEAINASNDRFVIDIVAEDEELSQIDGLPRIHLHQRDEYDLAAQFFRWEFATAVAGALLAINPFDELNVTESKENSKRVLEEFETSGTIEIALSDQAKLKEFIKRSVSERSFIAILAYIERTASAEAKLSQLRNELSTEFGVPVTTGYGPRYLHSTGQYHKGGPKEGIYVVIVDEPNAELPIADKPFSFKTLVKAQAAGDIKSLKDKGLPVIAIAG